MAIQPFWQNDKSLAVQIISIEEVSVGAHTVCAVDASVAIHIALAVGCITLYIGSGSDKASWFLENNAVFVGYFHADADPLCGKSDPHRAHFRFDHNVTGFGDLKALLAD